jgi:hypothetical protein
MALLVEKDSEIAFQININKSSAKTRQDRTGPGDRRNVKKTPASKRT